MEHDRGPSAGNGLSPRIEDDTIQTTATNGNFRISYVARKFITARQKNTAAKYRFQNAALRAIDTVTPGQVLRID